MKAVLPLRIASVLTFIHAVLHTIGGVFGKTPPGPATMVVATMKANPIQVLGVTRTLWDFYHGMGLGVTIALNSCFYFFAGPVIAEILIAACFAWAIVAAKPAIAV